MPTPTQDDLDYLAAHPEVADKFKAHFGALPEAPSRPKPTAYDVQYLVDNPQDLPKFEAHFGPIKDLIPQQPQQQLSPAGQVADEAKFLGGRLANAAISIPGLPADLVGLGLKGMDYLGGRKTPTANPLEAFSGETIRNAAHDYLSQGANAAGFNTTPSDFTPRDPQNGWEKLGGNIADFIGYGGRPNLRSAAEAVTGATAFTAAQEVAPDNPILQLAAAYLGHRVPGNIESAGTSLFPATKTFLRGNDAQSIQDTMAAYDRLGRFTGRKAQVMPGQLTGDYTQQQGIDALIARSPGGQPEILRANESQAQQLDEAVKKIAADPIKGRMGGVAPTETSTGAKILDDFESSAKRFRTRQERIENYFEGAIGSDTRVPMSTTAWAINNLKNAVRADPKVAEIVGDKTIKNIEAAITDGKGTLSYSAARALRTDLGELMPKAHGLGDVKAGQLKLIYGALSKDIGDIAAKNGLAKPWERYNNWAEKYYTDSEKILSRVGKPGDRDPERVARSLSNLDATGMKIALRNLTPEGRAKVAGFKLIEAASSSAAGKVAENVTTSYEKFLSNISKMKQDGTFDVVFGAPQFRKIRDVISDLETTSKASLRANKVAHDVSGAAALRGSAAYAIATHVFTGSYELAAGVFALTYIAPKYTARVMQSRAYQNWLASARSAAPGSERVLAQRLAMIAARDRDPETRDALREFATQYEKVLNGMRTENKPKGGTEITMGRGDAENQVDLKTGQVSPNPYRQ